MRNQRTYVVNQNNKHRLEHLCNDLSLSTNKNGLADALTVQEISQSLLVNMDRGLLINFTRHTQKHAEDPLTYIF